MRSLLILVIALTGAPALAASAGDLQASDSQTAPRVCARFEQRRSGSRRICLMAHQWQALLGPDWRQLVASRNIEEDMGALGARIRRRPDLSDPCMVCRSVDRPRTD